MSRRTKVVFTCIGVAAAAVVLFAATSPHPWVGRLVCDVRGGTYTNHFRGGFEEIVTSGYRCVDT